MDEYILLYNACQKGHITIVRYLVNLGANIHKEYNKGETLLFSACEGGNEALVKYLVELGADIHKVNNDGETPLFKACENGHKDVGKYLVEQGADLNKVNNDGKTPLFIANKNGYNDIGKYLIEIRTSRTKKEKCFDNVKGTEESNINYIENNNEKVIKDKEENNVKNIEKDIEEIIKSEEENNINIIERDIGKMNRCKEESNVKSKKESDNNVNEEDNITIALYDFYGRNSDELTFHKDDCIIVTNWNIKDGWATGYNIDNPQKKGIFPSALIRHCFESTKNLFLYNNYFTFFFFFLKKKLKHLIYFSYLFINLFIYIFYILL